MQSPSARKRARPFVFLLMLVVAFPGSMVIYALAAIIEASVLDQRALFVVPADEEWLRRRWFIMISCATFSIFCAWRVSSLPQVALWLLALSQFSVRFIRTTFALVVGFIGVLFLSLIAYFIVHKVETSVTGHSVFFVVNGPFKFGNLPKPASFLILGLSISTASVVAYRTWSRGIKRRISQFVILPLMMFGLWGFVDMSKSSFVVTDDFMLQSLLFVVDQTLMGGLGDFMEVFGWRISELQIPRDNLPVVLTILGYRLFVAAALFSLIGQWWSSLVEGTTQSETTKA